MRYQLLNYKAMRPTEEFLADFGKPKERGTLMQTEDTTYTPWFDNSEEEIERALDFIHYQVVFANN